MAPTLDPPQSTNSFNPWTMPHPKVHAPSSDRTQNATATSIRAKNLERNRIAATKCREKRKHQHEAMQTALETQTARRQTLQAEVSVLREQIWYLKNELFVHAKCDDRFINSQLDEMASRFSHGAGDPFRCPSPSFSVSTRSDQSVVDHGTASKTAMDGEMARQFYGGGLFDSFVDVPNM